MKKLIAIFILTFMLSSLLTGCTEASIKQGDDESVVDGSKDKTEETKDNESTENKEDNNSENTNTENKEDNGSDNNEDEPVQTLPDYGTSAGYRFYDMTLTDINGNQVNTEDFRGKIIIFNVWGLWCGPCLSELPDFNTVASEYDDEVVIIAVHNYDGYMYDMPDYVNSNFPDTKIIFAYDNSDSQAYVAAGGYKYVPQTAIINKDGVIVYSDSGALSHSALVSFIEQNK